MPLRARENREGRIRRFGSNARREVDGRGTKGSTIRWLQSQEQKLLRARAGSVIRILMRTTIGRGHPKLREERPRRQRERETRESPVALLKRGGAFFGVQTPNARRTRSCTRASSIRKSRRINRGGEVWSGAGKKNFPSERSFILYRTSSLRARVNDKKGIIIIIKERIITVTK